MPFDVGGTKLEDSVRLKVALEGLSNREKWEQSWGDRGGSRCVLGWLLEATEHNPDEATRLALTYLYPELPPKARKDGGNRVNQIWHWNDSTSHRNVVALLERAVARAVSI